MNNRGPYVSSIGLDRQGLDDVQTAYWNLPPAQLYEHAIRNGEAELASDGPLVARTGDHTGRSPNDRFIVKEASTDAAMWWGKVNRPIEQPYFDALGERVRAHLAGGDVYVFDGHAGADPRYRMPVRIVTQFAWHNLFASNMFVTEPDPARLAVHEPEFTVISAPGCKADPAIHGTNSSTFILVDLAQKTVLIGGTRYAGEIKKSIFTVMNFMLPDRGVLPMHCSANYGVDRDDVTLFFGLSGTGKTTLSADPERTLIGDDEHGWSDDGIFNFEGGCYAKVIRLSPEGEPEIYGTTRRFGTILENVVYDPETRRIDLDDDTYTENTRASYPISQLSNVDLGGQAGQPRSVVFLTCDAFGVLPPISRLTEPQALYHFLSGYTAKVAGTERGVTEPSATFSTCFGAPFMPRHPGVYAEMLGERIRKHGSAVWLINTGWTGGPYGVGSRMQLGHTRRMIHAALGGELASVENRTDPVFGLEVPKVISGVPSAVLDPRETWSDKAAFDTRAGELAAMFASNFETFEEHVSEDVRRAGPLASASA